MATTSKGINHNSGPNEKFALAALTPRANTSPLPPCEIRTHQDNMLDNGIRN